MSYNDIIVNRLVELIEKTQCLPWQVTWEGYANRPTNYYSKREYTGTNIIMLEMSKLANNYTSDYWMTYKQARMLKAFVKKGEKGTPILVPIFEKETEQDENGNEVVVEEKLLFTVKYVFNVEQTNIKLEIKENKPIANAEKVLISYLEKHNIPLITDCKAYYDPNVDRIAMPKIEMFKSTNAYYMALSHEIAHSTGHRTRLNRVGVANLRNEYTYSYEELIAEITACFIGNDLNIFTIDEEKNSASYLKNWLSVIKAQPKLLIDASQEATKIMKFIF